MRSRSKLPELATAVVAAIALLVGGCAGERSPDRQPARTQAVPVPSQASAVAQGATLEEPTQKLSRNGVLRVELVVERRRVEVGGLRRPTVAGARRPAEAVAGAVGPAPGFAHASGPVDAAIQMRQEMAKAFSLGPQVDEILLTRFCQQRNLFGDLDAVLQQRLTLAWVVRQQSHGSDTEVVQNLGRHLVVAGVDRESERDVRLDRVESFRLELHRSQLGQQADSPAFVTSQVDEYAASFIHDGA